MTFTARAGNICTESEDLKLMTATESIQLTGHHSPEDATNTTVSTDEAHWVTGVAPSAGCVYQRVAAEPCRTPSPTCAAAGTPSCTNFSKKLNF